MHFQMLGLPGLVILGVAASARAFEVGSDESAKKVMIWVANPFNQTKLDDMIVDLKAHRKGFTGIAYQFYAICGEGSDDAGGSNDCSKADAIGEPHLAPGHPVGPPADLGAQLKKALGNDVELWPVISYGNPGNASVLNRLLTSQANIAKFAADAVRVAHAQGLTGYNIDFEADGSIAWQGNVAHFLGEFVKVLHAASPPIGLSYDAGNTPVGLAPLDRWISMATYTSSLKDFESGVTQGLAASGDKFGVGLCPSCDPLNAAGVQARFDFLRTVDKDKEIQELDVWAYGSWPDFWWTAFESWLSEPVGLDSHTIQI